jgi:hypothetical protein
MITLPTLLELAAIAVLSLTLFGLARGARR